MVHRNIRSTHSREILLRTLKSCSQKAVGLSDGCRSDYPMDHVLFKILQKRLRTEESCSQKSVGLSDDPSSDYPMRPLPLKICLRNCGASIQRAVGLSGGSGSDYPIRRIIRPTYTGLSDGFRQQRLHFWEGYKYPSTFLWTASSNRKVLTIAASSSSTEISQSLHPNSLFFGGLKEKHRIYNFTKPFFISPSFT